MSAAQHDGADEPAPDSGKRQAWQLNGDARLQFWRDVYLAALPPLLATLPQGNASSFAVLGIARLAADAADTACAQHLSRNDRDELDLLLHTLLDSVPDRDGSR